MIESQPSRYPTIGRFLTVVVELGLLILVLREFQIETASFHQVIAAITFFGFIAHALLPFRYRLLGFAALSLSAIVAVLGWQVAAQLVGLGFVLIGICHLPLPHAIRFGLLLAAAVLLAYLRAHHGGAVWPILGSMFMFRLIIYLYDLRHAAIKTSIPATISYFFMLPNVVFPLFPIVDYQTFRSTYYQADADEIYQQGVVEMAVGVLHLLAYRMIYQYLTLAPEDVLTVTDLVRYLAFSVPLYLRISGLFHLIVGMLHLFGFRLPAPNREYLLSPSFSDYWRRINIYWKDFMMKLFYFPCYFRLRKRGTNLAVAVSTLYVFLASWLLLSYQWFWLRGEFPMRTVDFLYWGILGILLVGNSLHEMRHRRERPQAGLLALRILLTYAVLAVLWCLWTSESVGDFLALWSLPGRPSETPSMAAAALLLVGFVLALTVVVAVLRISAVLSQVKPTFFGSAAMVTLCLMALLVLGNPLFYSRLDHQAGSFLRDLRLGPLNQHDAELLRRNYYDNLVDVNRFNTRLWEMYTRYTVPWSLLKTSEAMDLRTDFLERGFVPLLGMQVEGQLFRTNRWGMRDRDYDMDKPPQTCRMALLGSSAAVGAFVAENESFKALLEDRLNRASANGQSYQVLNFSVPQYCSLHYVWLLENQVMQFHPDVVLCVVDSWDETFAVAHMARVVHRGIAIPYAELQDIVGRAGVHRSQYIGLIKKRLTPFGQEMTTWAYHRIVADCKRAGLTALYAYVPEVEVTGHRVDPTRVPRARQAGFITLDLSDVFVGYDAASVEASAVDFHPNAKGHRLIADRLYQDLRASWTHDHER